MNESPLPLPIHISEPAQDNYIVGKLEGFDTNDPTFDSLSAATRYALERSGIDNPLDFYREAWGVWERETGNLEGIAYKGVWFMAVSYD